uniref:Proteasome 26S subunit, non-ATPase 3 n=1 Tax=Myripristis murdjan TaxID=586833 RepID=A0A667XID4_9TELE
MAPCKAAFIHIVILIDCAPLLGIFFRSFQYRRHIFFSKCSCSFLIKAIRDGVIEASINHEKGFVQSKETMDIYGTREPQLAFHQRISFCLDIHNMSVKAMRFPPKAYNKDLESAEERREREQQDLEFAKEMAEDDDDSFP